MCRARHSAAHALGDDLRLPECGDPLAGHAPVEQGLLRVLSDARRGALNPGWSPTEAGRGAPGGVESRLESDRSGAWGAAGRRLPPRRRCRGPGCADARAPRSWRAPGRSRRPYPPGSRTTRPASSSRRAPRSDPSTPASSRGRAGAAAPRLPGRGARGAPRRSGARRRRWRRTCRRPSGRRRSIRAAAPSTMDASTT
jgi:hypothetical protein